MNQHIRDTISAIKAKYEADGFIILGVFGSVARGEERSDSDIDILYRCGPHLSDNYPGLIFFSLYEQVKAELQSSLGRRVDLADVNGLNDIGKKYILPETLYVN